MASDVSSYRILSDSSNVSGPLLGHDASVTPNLSIECNSVLQDVSSFSQPQVCERSFLERVKDIENSSDLSFVFSRGSLNNVKLKKKKRSLDAANHSNCGDKVSSIDSGSLTNEAFSNSLDSAQLKYLKVQLNGSHDPYCDKPEDIVSENPLNEIKYDSDFHDSLEYENGASDSSQQPLKFILRRSGRLSSKSNTPVHNKVVKRLTNVKRESKINNSFLSCSDSFGTLSQGETKNEVIKRKSSVRFVSNSYENEQEYIEHIQKPLKSILRRSSVNPTHDATGKTNNSELKEVERTKSCKMGAQVNLGPMFGIDNIDGETSADVDVTNSFGSSVILDENLVEETPAEALQSAKPLKARASVHFNFGSPEEPGAAKELSFNEQNNSLASNNNSLCQLNEKGMYAISPELRKSQQRLIKNRVSVHFKMDDSAMEESCAENENPKESSGFIDEKQVSVLLDVSSPTGTDKPTDSVDPLQDLSNAAAPSENSFCNLGCPSMNICSQISKEGSASFKSRVSVHFALNESENNDSSNGSLSSTPNKQMQMIEDGGKEPSPFHNGEDNPVASTSRMSEISHASGSFASTSLVEHSHDDHCASENSGFHETQTSFSVNKVNVDNEAECPNDNLEKETDQSKNSFIQNDISMDESEGNYDQRERYSNLNDNRREENFDKEEKHITFEEEQRTTESSSLQTVDTNEKCSNTLSSSLEGKHISFADLSCVINLDDQNSFRNEEGSLDHSALIPVNEPINLVGDEDEINLQKNLSKGSGVDSQKPNISTKSLIENDDTLPSDDEKIQKNYISENQTSMELNLRTPTVHITTDKDGSKTNNEYISEEFIADDNKKDSFHNSSLSFDVSGIRPIESEMPTENRSLKTEISRTDNMSFHENRTCNDSYINRSEKAGFEVTALDFENRELKFDETEKDNSIENNDTLDKTDLRTVNTEKLSIATADNVENCSLDLSLRLSMKESLDHQLHVSESCSGIDVSRLPRKSVLRRSSRYSSKSNSPIQHNKILKRLSKDRNSLKMSEDMLNSSCSSKKLKKKSIKRKSSVRFVSNVYENEQGTVEHSGKPLKSILRRSSVNPINHVPEETSKSELNEVTVNKSPKIDSEMNFGTQIASDKIDVKNSSEAELNTDKNDDCSQDSALSFSLDVSDDTFIESEISVHDQSLKNEISNNNINNISENISDEEKNPPVTENKVINSDETENHSLLEDNDRQETTDVSNANENKLNITADSTAKNDKNCSLNLSLRPSIEDSLDHQVNVSDLDAGTSQQPRRSILRRSSRYSTKGNTPIQHDKVPISLSKGETNSKIYKRLTLDVSENELIKKKRSIRISSHSGENIEGEVGTHFKSILCPGSVNADDKEEVNDSEQNVEARIKLCKVDPQVPISQAEVSDGETTSADIDLTNISCSVDDNLVLENTAKANLQRGRFSVHFNFDSPKKSSDEQEQSFYQRQSPLATDLNRTIQSDIKLNEIESNTGSPGLRKSDKRLKSRVSVHLKMDDSEIEDTDEFAGEKNQNEGPGDEVSGSKDTDKPNESIEPLLDWSSVSMLSEYFCSKLCRPSLNVPLQTLAAPGGSLKNRVSVHFALNESEINDTSLSVSSVPRELMPKTEDVGKGLSLTGFNDCDPDESSLRTDKSTGSPNNSLDSSSVVEHSCKENSSFQPTQASNCNSSKDNTLNSSKGIVELEGANMFHEKNTVQTENSFNQNDLFTDKPKEVSIEQRRENCDEKVRHLSFEEKQNTDFKEVISAESNATPERQIVAMELTDDKQYSHVRLEYAHDEQTLARKSLEPGTSQPGEKSKRSSSINFSFHAHQTSWKEMVSNNMDDDAMEKKTVKAENPFILNEMSISMDEPEVKTDQREVRSNLNSNNLDENIKEKQRSTESSATSERQIISMELTVDKNEKCFNTSSPGHLDQNFEQQQRTSTESSATSERQIVSMELSVDKNEKCSNTSSSGLLEQNFEQQQRTSTESSATSERQIVSMELSVDTNEKCSNTSSPGHLDQNFDQQQRTSTVSSATSERQIVSMELSVDTNEKCSNTSSPGHLDQNFEVQQRTSTESIAASERQIVSMELSVDKNEKCSDTSSPGRLDRNFEQQQRTSTGSSATSERQIVSMELTVGKNEKCPNTLSPGRLDQNFEVQQRTSTESIAASERQIVSMELSVDNNEKCSNTSSPGHLDQNFEVQQRTSTVSSATSEKLLVSMELTVDKNENCSNTSSPGRLDQNFEQQQRTSTESSATSERQIVSMELTVDKNEKCPNTSSPGRLDKNFEVQQRTSTESITASERQIVSMELSVDKNEKCSDTSSLGLLDTSSEAEKMKESSQPSAFPKEKIILNSKEQFSSNNLISKPSLSHTVVTECVQSNESNQLAVDDHLGNNLQHQLTSDESLNKSSLTPTNKSLSINNSTTSAINEDKSLEDKHYLSSLSYSNSLCDFPDETLPSMNLSLSFSSVNSTLKEELLALGKDKTTPKKSLQISKRLDQGGHNDSLRSLILGRRSAVHFSEVPSGKLNDSQVEVVGTKVQELDTSSIISEKFVNPVEESSKCDTEESGHFSLHSYRNKSLNSTLTLKNETMTSDRLPSSSLCLSETLSTAYSCSLNSQDHTESEIHDSLARLSNDLSTSYSSQDLTERFNRESLCAKDLEKRSNRIKNISVSFNLDETDRLDVTETQENNKKMSMISENSFHGKSSISSHLLSSSRHTDFTYSDSNSSFHSSNRTVSDKNAHSSKDMSSEYSELNTTIIDTTLCKSTLQERCVKDVSVSINMDSTVQSDLSVESFQQSLSELSYSPNKASESLKNNSSGINSISSKSFQEKSQLSNSCSNVSLKKRKISVHFGFGYPGSDESSDGEGPKDPSAENSSATKKENEPDSLKTINSSISKQNGTLRTEEISINVKENSLLEQNYEGSDPAENKDKDVENSYQTSAGKPSLSVSGLEEISQRLFTSSFDKSNLINDSAETSSICSTREFMSETTDLIQNGKHLEEGTLLSHPVQSVSAHLDLDYALSNSYAQCISAASIDELEVIHEEACSSVKTDTKLTEGEQFDFIDEPRPFETNSFTEQNISQSTDLNVCEGNCSETKITTTLKGEIKSYSADLPLNQLGNERGILEETELTVSKKSTLGHNDEVEEEQSAALPRTEIGLPSTEEPCVRSEPENANVAPTSRKSRVSKLNCPSISSLSITNLDSIGSEANTEQSILKTNAENVAVKHVSVHFDNTTLCPSLSKSDGNLSDLEKSSDVCNKENEICDGKKNTGTPSVFEQQSMNISNVMRISSFEAVTNEDKSKHKTSDDIDKGKHVSVHIAFDNTTLHPNDGNFTKFDENNSTSDQRNIKEVSENSSSLKDDTLPPSSVQMSNDNKKSTFKKIFPEEHLSHNTNDTSVRPTMIEDKEFTKSTKFLNSELKDSECQGVSYALVSNQTKPSEGNEKTSYVGQRDSTVSSCNNSNVSSSFDQGTNKDESTAKTSDGKVSGKHVSVHMNFNDTSLHPNVTNISPFDHETNEDESTAKTSNGKVSGKHVSVHMNLNETSVHPSVTAISHFDHETSEDETTAKTSNGKVSGKHVSVHMNLNETSVHPSVTAISHFDHETSEDESTAKTSDGKVSGKHVSVHMNFNDTSLHPNVTNISPFDHETNEDESTAKTSDEKVSGKHVSVHMNLNETSVHPSVTAISHFDHETSEDETTAKTSNGKVSGKHVSVHRNLNDTSVHSNDGHVAHFESGVPICKEDNTIHPRKIVGISSVKPLYTNHDVTSGTIKRTSEKDAIINSDSASNENEVCEEKTRRHSMPSLAETVTNFKNTPFTPLESDVYNENKKSKVQHVSVHINFDETSMQTTVSETQANLEANESDREAANQKMSVERNELSINRELSYVDNGSIVGAEHKKTKALQNISETTTELEKLNEASLTKGTMACPKKSSISQKSDPKTSEPSGINVPKNVSAPLNFDLTYKETKSFEEIESSTISVSKIKNKRSAHSVSETIPDITASTFSSSKLNDMKSSLGTNIKNSTSGKRVSVRFNFDSTSVQSTVLGQTDVYAENNESSEFFQENVEADIIPKVEDSVYISSNDKSIHSSKEVGSEANSVPEIREKSETGGDNFSETFKEKPQAVEVSIGSGVSLPMPAILDSLGLASSDELADDNSRRKESHQEVYELNSPPLSSLENSSSRRVTRNSKNRTLLLESKKKSGSKRKSETTLKSPNRKRNRKSSELPNLIPRLATEKEMSYIGLNKSSSQKGDGDTNKKSENLPPQSVQGESIPETSSEKNCQEGENENMNSNLENCASYQSSSSGRKEDDNKSNYNLRKSSLKSSRVSTTRKNVTFGNTVYLNASSSSHSPHVVESKNDEPSTNLVKSNNESNGHVFVCPPLPSVKPKDKSKSSFKRSRSQVEASHSTNESDGSPKRRRSDKSINELSYDTFLDVSEIPKDKTMFQKRIIFHSTPIHPVLERRRSEKKLSNVIHNDDISDKMIQVSKTYFGSSTENNITKVNSKVYSPEGQSEQGSKTNNASVYKRRFTRKLNVPSLSTIYPSTSQIQLSPQDSVIDSPASSYDDSFSRNRKTVQFKQSVKFKNISALSKDMSSQRKSYELSTSPSKSDISSRSYYSASYDSPLPSCSRVDEHSVISESDQRPKRVDFRELSDGSEVPELRSSSALGKASIQNVSAALKSTNGAAAEHSLATPLEIEEPNGDESSPNAEPRSSSRSQINRPSSVISDLPTLSSDNTVLRNGLGFLIPKTAQKQVKPVHCSKMVKKKTELPDKWVSPHLLDNLSIILEATFAEESRAKAMCLIKHLCAAVASVKSLNTYKDIELSTVVIRNFLSKYDICKNQLDYFLFLRKYTPFDFQRKVFPLNDPAFRNSRRPLSLGDSIIIESEKIDICL